MSASGMDLPGDIIIDNDDDEDDVLDLFSFGAEGATALEPTDQPLQVDNSTNKSLSRNVDSIHKLATPKSSSTHGNEDDDNNSYVSNDSFIELLENAQHDETSMLEGMGAIAIVGDKESNKEGSIEKNKKDHTDMQEILDWLDDDDKKGNELQLLQEENLKIVKPPQRPPPLQNSTPKPHSIPPPLQSSESDALEFAVKSPDSSKSDIRRLLEKEKFAVGPEIRPHLWSKMICEKTLEETLQSSLADSFQQWEKDYKQEEQIESLEKQSNFLAERIISVVKDGDFQFYRKAIEVILRNHFNTASEADGKNLNGDWSCWEDTLVSPVLCAILSSGVPPSAACVMLGQIIPSFMPILALKTKERQEAAMILHRGLYLLACYHLPLLVLHLDKFVPGWHQCYPQGKIPQSWLISHLAGETDGAFINAKLLLHLWDSILAAEDRSLRFFLVIAILDLHAERLLLLTDEDLNEELNNVLSFSWTLKSVPAGIAVESLSDKASDRKIIERVQEWIDRADLLCKETPIVVTRKLKALEDQAVANSLVARQEAKEEELRLQKMAEEKAAQEAREAEKERKADEARARLNRARLVAFYRQYNPGKENNIDKIMKSYEGRYEMLDAKLKLKYGVGFNPAQKPKTTASNKNNSKIFSSMNSGFGQNKPMSKNKKPQNMNSQPGKKGSGIVQVPASEVLPVVCRSKGANKRKLAKLNNDSGNDRVPLKFYIVDCRLDAAIKEQGRLPTSAVFCAETMTDRKRIKEREMFESLRGSAHICIMSEGYDALPRLYGHKMTSELTELVKEENKRKSACARFFLLKGFPYVSIMEGGFASAHAYLCREGPKNHLNVSDILIEYNPDMSIFGRFEKLHNMSSRDKAQRSLQNLFDSSMTALTKHSKRLESLASEVDGVTDEQTHQKGSPKNISSELKIVEKTPTENVQQQNGQLSPAKGLANRKNFPRFGSLGIGQNLKRNESSANPGKANKFAGSFKKFQMNTIARIRTAEGAKDQSQDSASIQTATGDSILSDSSPTPVIQETEDKRNGFEKPTIAKV